jgi:hypothetical protein
LAHDNDGSNTLSLPVSFTGWRHGALYVDNLLLGLNSLLIISDNVEVYFRTSNSWSSAHYSLLAAANCISSTTQR